MRGKDMAETEWNVPVPAWRKAWEFRDYHLGCKNFVTYSERDVCMVCPKRGGRTQVNTFVKEFGYRFGSSV